MTMQGYYRVETSLNNFVVDAQFKAREPDLEFNKEPDLDSQQAREEFVKRIEAFCDCV
jgi:hypothetical protein